MTISREIRVLEKFGPCLRILTAFNLDHFRHNDPQYIRHSIFYLCVSIIILVALPTWIVVISWYLIENDFEWILCVVAVPIVVSILQLDATFIAMMFMNHTVTETIAQLQRAIDQREWFL